MSINNVVTSFWERNKEYIHQAYIARHDGHTIANKLTDILSEIFCAGPSYYYIVDFATRKIEYISSSVKEVTGLDPAAVCFNDIVNCVHPDDIPYIQTAEEFNLKKMKELGTHLTLQTKMAYCFRERTASGNYEMFQLQALSIDIDATKNSYRILNIHTNINHITPVNNYTLTLTGINGHNLFLQFDLRKQLELAQDRPVYTPRELEIVKLIAQGLETNQIAQHLFISPHTAKTHRKNIMQKADARNTAQLVNFCLQKGLL
ncbi:MAG TPA: LuxR C-terminal-related transcriptional regulator [Niabella sp.]|nr:LuxR C-terminal-related transcriptional regulator [Niabella sp.]